MVRHSSINRLPSIELGTSRGKSPQVRNFFLLFFLCVFVFVLSARNVEALEISPSQLVDLFVSLGIISVEKADIARQVLVSQTVDVFTKDLFLGVDDFEVKELQKVLNLQDKTAISLFGDGSLGNETTYFGTKTKSAVIKFQELYAPEILIPVGLSSGTGFVGALTRKKLNFLLQNKDFLPKPVEAMPPPEANIKKELEIKAQTSEQNTTSVETELVLGYFSSHEGNIGDAVVAHGYGFTKTGNILHFGSHKIENLASFDGSTLSFVIPSKIPLGKYEVFIENNFGNKDTVTIFFVVKSAETSSPKILSSAPREGVWGETVTIIGEHFTSTGNDIYTSYGIIRNVSSEDGKKLVFKPVFYEKTEEDVGSGASVKTWFYIVNTNGVSKETKTFILKL